MKSMSGTVQAPPVALFPDPVVTANIYRAGRLDEVIHRVMAPVWGEFQQHDPDHACYLWLMRYGKGGEHLKVRFHGPEVLAPRFRDPLGEAVEAYLAGLPENVEPLLKKGVAGAPPIDVEDNVEEDHPDRSFLWTRYGRSHVSLGGKPFLLDDRYAALFTTCMAKACEQVLALQLDDQGAFSHKARQTTLLKALIGGLAALGFPPEKRAQYLAYHRDWLLRFLLPKERRAEVEPVQGFQGHFDERLAKMGKILETLGRAAAEEWQDRTEPQTKFRGSGAPWRRALVDLYLYVRPFGSDPDYHLDPFASDPAFSPVFKVFHGLGNQLGLNLAEEAFAHHILFTVSREVGGDDPETPG
jgi:hypothetical protein